MSEHPCIECNVNITGRSHAIDCDGCGRWVHRKCGTATWQAIREVFPGAVVKGCVFHLTQRIYRKIQNEGLSTAYVEKGDVFQFLWQLMSLPYLPSSQIRLAFERLRAAAVEVGGPVLRIVEYVESTWISGSVWPLSCWSVFREVVRTNNDAEGWHRLLNGKAGASNLGLYKLTVLLREEAATVDLQIPLVSDSLLSKIRRKKYQRVHGRLEDAWDRYEEEDIKTS